MENLYEKGVKKDIYANGILVGEYISTGDPDKDIEAAHEIIKRKGFNGESSLINQMHNQANSFANTAKELYERDLRATPIKNGMSLVPFIVNASFSIELYLKTLHAIEGRSEKGHSLVKLYGKLEDGTKSIIKSSASDVSKYYDQEEVGEFEKYIQNLDRAFEQWRYAYETKKLSYIGIQYTRFVYHTLHESCCCARKEGT